MYKINKNLMTGQVTSINKQEGDVLTCIPFDPANTDYQAYLRWLEAGNEPLPADEPQ
jgi:hypothetical protein